MTPSVSIDFISDVVCPWCALGATALEQAIENVAGEVSVELTYKPFELNPDMPAEGEKAVEHLMRKYGRTAEDVAAGKAMQIARGEAIGFTFDLEKRSSLLQHVRCSPADVVGVAGRAAGRTEEDPVARLLHRRPEPERSRDAGSPGRLKQGWMRQRLERCWRPERSPTKCVSLKRFTASTASIRYRPWSSTVVTWCPVRSRSSTTNRC